MGDHGFGGGQHAGLEFAQSLDVAHGVGEIRPLEIEVVDRHRLLEDRGVLVPRVDGHERRVVVNHVVPPHQPGLVGQAVGMGAVGRAQEEQGRIDCTAGDHIARGLNC